jgi:hypothetical protein
MTGRLLGTILLVLSSRHGSPTANAVLLVKVVDGGSSQPLPNAEIIDLDASTHRFTNAEGEARIAWPDRGRLRLRVRQLGFQFQDRDLTRAADATAAIDTATFTLSRVAYTLPSVATRAPAKCAADGDAASKALAAVALGQLQMSAERYESFRKAYPFRIKQKRRTIHFNANGTTRDVREGTEEETSTQWGERYQPGRVIDRRGNGFSVPLLFLSALADPVFWDHHCFAVRGVETFHDARVLRLEFQPALSVSSVDWMGSAFVDSATSVLERVEFQLVGLQPSDVVRRLEGYTTFRSPSPYIVVPDSTVGMWWRRGETDYEPPWKGPDAVQLIELLTVTYNKAKPPANAATPRR